MTIEKQESEAGLCSRCKKNPAAEIHACPFQEEINDDHEEACDCCDECTQECLWDI